VLVAGAFYAGLRASDWFKRQPTAQVFVDPLAKGVEAYQRLDYQGAAAEFDSVAKREPGNAMAFYWLGRVRLEQKDFAQAAASFEQAIALRPGLLDAYAHAAAAYEAMGENAKVAATLSRYVEEVKKEGR